MHMNKQRTKQPMQARPQVIHHTRVLWGRLLCAYALFFAIGVEMLIPPLAVAQPVTPSQIDTAGDASGINSRTDRRANSQTSSTENQANNDEPAPLNPNDGKQGNQGCCSYHGGICGKTSEGALLCCDGAISPTCDL